MNKDDGHIDDFFKHKLQNFEVTPDPILWTEIAKNLPQEKKKRRVIPLWFWPTGIAGVAASIALLIVLNTSKTSSLKTTPIVIVDDICPEEEETNSIHQNEIVYTTKDTSTSNSTKEIERAITINNEKTTNANQNKTVNSTKDASISNTIKKETARALVITTKIQEIKNSRFSKKRNLEKSSTTATSKKTIALNNTIDRFDNPANTLEKNLENEKSDIKRTTANKEKGDVEINKELVINEILGKEEEAEKTTSKESNKSSRKWSIQPQIAPLVYNSISGNSSIEATFDNEVQSTEAGISYGVKIAYQASPKWKIRSGISTANVDVFTNKIFDGSLRRGDINSIEFDNFDPIINDISNPIDAPVTQNPNNSGGGRTPESPAISQNPPSRTPAPPVTNDQEQQSETPPIQRDDLEGEIQQQISYIEIPIEFSYKLLDKRFGTSIITGISTFILSQNNTEILFNQGRERRITGESNNLNTTSFSGNFGIGLDYKITQNIQISIEPTVKFQFNAFESSTDFNPYIFGVYSGIKFRL